MREGSLLKKKKGETIVEFPLTVGAVGTLLAPPLAAIGAIAALVTNCTLIVIKKD